MHMKWKHSRPLCVHLFLMSVPHDPMAWSHAALQGDAGQAVMMRQSEINPENPVPLIPTRKEAFCATDGQHNAA